MGVLGGVLAVVVAAAGAFSSTTVASGTAVADGSAVHANYIDAVHDLFLDRVATDTEVEAWTPAMELGARGGLTRTLALSDEWAGAQVSALYERVLGRPAEAEGRAHWVDVIAAGATLEEVAAGFYGSDEYLDRAGATVEGFVDRLYTDLLGRAAEDEGRTYWVGRIEAGVTRTEVASQFYDSVESRRDRVDAHYRQILGRRAEPDGRAYWMEQVRTIGDVQLAADLAASAEFHERVTGVDAPPAPERGTGTGFGPYAHAGPVALVHPTPLVELIGFHQSGHDGGVDQDRTRASAPAIVLPSRGRGTPLRSAADVVVPADTELRAPVTGTVLSAETYELYCEYRDDRLVIEPDDAPGWRVVVLHLDGVQVRAGDRIVAGRTPIAPRATVLPFDSQVERYTPDPPWPHIHVEVFDPAVPDRPSGECP